MKLNVKLALYVTILAIVSAAFLSVTSYIILLDNISKETDEATRSLAETVYSTAAVSAYVENKDLANDVVQGLIKNGIIRCAEIRSVERVLARSDLCSGENFFHQKIFSPFDNEEIVGAINLYINDDFIRTKAQENAIREVINVSVITCFSIFFVFFATYFLITQPINRLATRLESIDFSPGSQGKLPEAERNDEIGIISRTVNMLVGNARSQIQKEKLLTLQTKMLTENYKHAFELSCSALAVVNIRLEILSMNAQFRSLFSPLLDNPSEREVEGSGEVLAKDSWISLFEDALSIKRKILTAQSINAPLSFEVKMLPTHDYIGNFRWYNFTFVKAQDAVGSVSYHIFLDDITKHHQRLMESEKAASVDDLTGLLNRMAAQRKIGHLLSSREDGIHMGIMVIDLDGFKPINDTYGHKMGDHVLKTISQRIIDATRKSDVVARWGGDEFVVALCNISDKQCYTVGEELIRTISAPILIDEYTLIVGASIGISMTTARVGDFSSLFDRADEAMYQVKNSGKNGVALLRP